jgi:hypothetical protein
LQRLCPIDAFSGGYHSHYITWPKVFGNDHLRKKKKPPHSRAGV